MRKINKIMMATVSILLTLVLISSCVLSGIFAKYVTSKTASSQMQFERFGVVVNTVVNKEALEELGATVTLPDANSDEVKSGVYSVTIENLPIRPGIGTTPNNATLAPDVYSALVKFAFSGEANVPVRITISTEIAYNNIDWTVPGEILGSGKSDTKYLPIGFNLYTYNGDSRNASYSLGDPWRVGSNTEATNRSQNVAANLVKYLSGFEQDTQNKHCAYKEFYPSTTEAPTQGNIVFATKKDNDKTAGYNEKSKTVTAIAEGIYWPLNTKDAIGVSNVDEALENRVDTWFGETFAYDVNSENNSSITLTYTVKVEQITPPST